MEEKQEKNNPGNDSYNPAENKTHEEILPDELPQLDAWDIHSKNNSALKKYIFYVSKDFVPLMDNMNTDERNAYINDAIQKKIDLSDEKKQKNKKTRLILHFILSIITICVLTPFALLAVNKAIMVTFENYKYSQDNFEKLYKQRFEKDRAYMRSVQYNKERENKSK